MTLSVEDNEDTLASRVKAARKKLGYTQTDVAKAVPMAQASYQQVESGYSKRSVFINEIAKILGVTTEWLLYGEKGDENGDGSNALNKYGKSANSKTINPSLVPVITWSAANTWSKTTCSTEQDVIGTAPRPEKLSDNGFGLRIQTQNMLPEFKIGEVIYVEPQSTFHDIEDGSYLIVSRDGDREVSFKQLVLGASSEDRYLKNLNPDLPSSRIEPLGDYYLVGVVIGKYVEF